MLIQCFPAKTPLSILTRTILDCLRWSHMHNSLSRLHPHPPNASSTLRTHIHTHPRVHAHTDRPLQKALAWESQDKGLPELVVNGALHRGSGEQDGTSPAAVRLWVSGDQVSSVALNQSHKILSV